MARPISLEDHIDATSPIARRGTWCQISPTTKPPHYAMSATLNHHDGRGERRNACFVSASTSQLREHSLFPCIHVRHIQILHQSPRTFHFKMPRSRISSSYFAGPERRRRRGRDLSLSSIDSHSRTPSPRPGLRHYRPFRDYTDRGRDVEVRVRRCQLLVTRISYTCLRSLRDISTNSH